jgi:hypothetical protein
MAAIGVLAGLEALWHEPEHETPEEIYPMDAVPIQSDTGSQ